MNQRCSTAASSTRHRHRQRYRGCCLLDNTPLRVGFNIADVAIIATVGIGAQDSISPAPPIGAGAAPAEATSFSTVASSAAAATASDSDAAAEATSVTSTAAVKTRDIMPLLLAVAKMSTGPVADRSTAGQTFPDPGGES